MTKAQFTDFYSPIERIMMLFMIATIAVSSIMEYVEITKTYLQSHEITLVLMVLIPLVLIITVVSNALVWLAKRMVPDVIDTLNELEKNHEKRKTDNKESNRRV